MRISKQPMLRCIKAEIWLRRTVKLSRWGGGWGGWMLKKSEIAQGSEKKAQNVNTSI